MADSPGPAPQAASQESTPSQPARPLNHGLLKLDRGASESLQGHMKTEWVGNVSDPVGLG